MTAAIFARDSEAEACRLLHEHGFDALEGRWPGLAHNLINGWCDRKLMTLKYDNDGRMVIRTYKKYARGGTA